MATIIMIVFVLAAPGGLSAVWSWLAMAEMTAPLAQVNDMLIRPTSQLK